MFGRRGGGSPKKKPLPLYSKTMKKSRYVEHLATSCP